MPTTVIEGLFYKNVVVASDVWWTNEISTENDLILFTKWNVSDLTKKLKYAIINYHELSWKSKVHINKNFNRNNIILDLRNYFM